MGIVRDWIESDVSAVTEWVARKIHNHNPLRVRSKERGVVGPTMIALDIDNNSVITVAGDGQAYLVTVQGLGAFNDLDEKQREEIAEKNYSYNEWKTKKAREAAVA